MNKDLQTIPAHMYLPLRKFDERVEKQAKQNEIPSLMWLQKWINSFKHIFNKNNLPINNKS